MRRWRDSIRFRFTQYEKSPAGDIERMLHGEIIVAAFPTTKRGTSSPAVEVVILSGATLVFALACTYILQTIDDLCHREI